MAVKKNAILVQLKFHTCTDMCESTPEFPVNFQFAAACVYRQEAMLVMSVVQNTVFTGRYRVLAWGVSRLPRVPTHPGGLVVPTMRHSRLCRVPVPNPLAFNSSDTVPETIPA